ncbi:MAG: germination protein YpeB [Caldicoprobacterales bacterium]|jgi:spore germination protein|nr:germination protein YpeB [Clostridiales bacterium]
MRKWILPAILAIALAFTGAWGYQQYKLNQKYSRHMDNMYQKSFYELVGNVGNVENGLSKLMVSGDRSQHMMLLSDISRQAEAAQLDLGQLPVSHIALDKTSKFLNQLSDYTYYLNKKISGGKTINLKEMENLQHLHENAVKLNEELTKLTTETLKNQMNWGELMRSAKASFYEASDDIYTKKFVNIQKTGMEYPSLIYDGPFSEALDQHTGTELKGAAVTEQQARDIALKFIGTGRAVKIEKASDSSNGILDTWGFQVWVKGKPDLPFNISVSKKGGKVVNLICPYVAEKETISIKQAMEKAGKFLEDNGYEGMVPTYQQNFDGISTINFAYVQDDIIIYPDLIKVKIALDDGNIYGLEARNYLLSHRDRKFKEPALSMEEAQKLVNPNLEIISSRKAVIPTEGKRERLCYEFKGKLGEKNFIVYIDANSGQEADILQIIDTENGSLTM